MKQLQLIHQEPGEECFEVLKSCIVEDQQIKEYRIDKDTLLQNLPEKILNNFLDFLGPDDKFRQLMLYMIKKGTSG